MGFNRFDIEYQLRPRSSRIFCGSGTGTSGLDRTFLRDVRGRPIIPGSHLKGVIRQRCEDLLATLGQRFTDPHRLEGEENRSILDRIFGRPGQEDLRSVFSDIVLSDGSGMPQIRPRIRMNRRLGRPEPNALFDTEYLALEADDRLLGSIVMWTDDGGDGVPLEVSLLCGGIRLVDSIGGDKGTGAGDVDISISSIRCGERTLQAAAVLAGLDKLSTTGGDA